ncbi:MAG: LUD domain-containing protein [Planctomycetes bacterium]|nr:LUD domain-containing protein [Planctomycetota bacterium]
MNSGAHSTEFAALLDRLSRRAPLAPTPLPDETAAIIRQVDECADAPREFEVSARRAGVEVVRLSSDELCGVLVDLAKSMLASSAWISPNALSLLEAGRQDLANSLATAGCTLGTMPEDHARFAADLGVTLVRAAIVETGSLLVEAGAGEERGTSLIPAVHAAIVPASRIVPDLVDAFDLIASRPLASALTLITGPSKTADIEGVLVTGVHGPGRVIALIVLDA